MNCPIRTDPLPDEGHNQNPSDLANEIITNHSLNHRRNSTQGLRNQAIHLGDGSHETIDDLSHDADVDGKMAGMLTAGRAEEEQQSDREKIMGSLDGRGPGQVRQRLETIVRKVKKYTKFIGPGFMVSVAYIDPGNYATDVAAGASFRFRLLFMVLLSNIIAIFLQSLCIKLGTVTGMNLAENCKAHLPRWLNYVLFVFGAAAIIVTDIAEVIGTAIALNLLLKIPLVAGCAISIADVLVILLFYNASGMSMRALRVFEAFVALLVFGVVICFSFQLSLIQGVEVGEVFRGYLPSSALIKSKGLYQSCGILGATVMPHSLYLGSGVVQSRLKDFDAQHRRATPSENQNVSDRRHSADSEDDCEEPVRKYKPSLAAIKSCLNYSILELAISLFTFALFVNSAILIVAAASLSDLSAAEIDAADLFSIHDLLSKSLAPAAGTIFALALLLSGISAGIVCTIAGQIVSEGQLNISMKPWLQRLMTRSISITPSIIVAGAVGREGLSAALEASQVALSVILPVVSAPVIWFTCRSTIMSVWTEDGPPSTDYGSFKSAVKESTNTVAGTDPPQTSSPSVAEATSNVLATINVAMVTKSTSNGSKNNDSSLWSEKALSSLDTTPISPTDSNMANPAHAAKSADNELQATGRIVIMRNHWITAGIAIMIWGIILVMNVALLVLVGLNKE